MKSSYKIAVAAALVLLIVVVASYLRMEKPAQPNAKPTTPATDAGGPAAASEAAANSGSGTSGGDANSPKVSIDELAARMRSHYDSVDGVPAPASTSDKTAAAVPATQPAPSVAMGPTTQPGTSATRIGPTASAGSVTSITPPHDSGIFDSTPGDHHAAGSAASVPIAPRTYTIAAGDTFISIAEKELGSANRWHAVAEANPLVDPSKLKVGQVIKLPETAIAADNSHSSTSGSGGGVAAGAITRTHSTAVAADGGTSYTVQAGDTLSSIARQFYNNSGLWRTIFNANKKALAGSPNHVREGMKLTIPPLASAAR